MSLKILLEDQIKKLFKDSPELKSVKKNPFEIAVASFANVRILNGLEVDDLIDGIMGEGGDEGIDLCYVFCNGTLVKDENHPINRDSSIKVKFFQVKKEDGFSTDGFRKFKEGIEEIFNLELDIQTLEKIGANEDIREAADLIRKIFRKGQLERAKFSCEVYYATVSPELNISEKIKHLEDELKKNVLSIPFDFEYWGAQKLLDLTKNIEENIEIVFDSQPLNISEKDVDTTGFAGFVNGNTLLKSLIDDENNFKSHLTEGNVRYFLGEDKKINSSIIDTASDEQKAANFWAMNNGLTIIGDSIAPLDAKGYSIINPQIVNGCQTIHCLYVSYYQNGNKLPDALKVFVKIVKTENPDIQTDIISATNSQNPVKSASLKANDNIQRNIEIHLKEAGILYERRDNYYKRQGYSGNKVVGLLKMAQIVHTFVNKESVTAVNDTTTLFDTETKYNSIFSDKADFDLYKFAVMLYQKIWTFKNSDLRTTIYPNEQKDLISRGGFVFLHIMGSLLLSDAEFNEGENKGLTKKLTGNFIIETPARKNEFTKRKKWLFDNIENNELLEQYYIKSKLIFFNAALHYSKNTGKSQNSLFKNRAFDKDYLRPEIDKYIDSINPVITTVE